MLSKGFRYKVIDTLVNFKTKPNVEKIAGPFFGYELAAHLLARNKVSFQVRLSVFKWKKL